MKGENLQDWLKTVPGRYLLDWEKTQFESIVTDIFGYHALQLGLPELDTLQTSRMPHRWLATPNTADVGSIIAINNIANSSINTPVNLDNKCKNVDFFTEFEALPFPENSLDLLVLPHSLELSADPHATLREAERVLMPEGKLIICGFNPLSLWGFKQKRSHVYKRLNFGDLYLPEAGEFIGHKRLRDWLRLLNFDVEASHFGCYRPAVRSENGLQRFALMEKLGSRYWPIFGSVYLLVAVKRVRGMRMQSPIKKLSKLAKNTPISIATQAINTPVIVKKSPFKEDE